MLLCTKTSNSCPRFSCRSSVRLPEVGLGYGTKKSGLFSLETESRSCSEKIATPLLPVPSHKIWFESSEMDLRLLLGRSEFCAVNISIVEPSNSTSPPSVAKKIWPEATFYSLINGMY